MDVLQPIRDLGEEVERAWGAIDFEESKFSIVASEVLARANIRRRILEEVIHWTLAGPALFNRRMQTDGFGQPAIPVFRANRFYVEVLFWLDATTTIHQHGFAGAFQVLEGSSLHTRYQFECERLISPNLQLGRLTTICHEVLREGDIRRIDAGQELIHSLFHLDHPSVTLVVRTYSDGNPGVQYDYLYPGVAFSPTIPSSATLKARTLELVWQTRKTSFTEQATAAVLSSSDTSLFYLLTALVRNGADTRLLETVFAIAVDRHAEFAWRIVTALREYVRRIALNGRRSSIQDAPSRLILAALIMCESRRSLLEVVGAAFGSKEPAEVFVQVIGKVSAQGGLLTGAEIDEVAVETIRQVLEGRSRPEILDAVQSVYDIDPSSTATLEDLYDALSSSPTFCVLFR